LRDLGGGPVTGIVGDGRVGSGQFIEAASRPVQNYGSECEAQSGGEIPYFIDRFSPAVLKAEPFSLGYLDRFAQQPQTGVRKNIPCPN